MENRMLEKKKVLADQNEVKRTGDISLQPRSKLYCSDSNGHSNTELIWVTSVWYPSRVGIFVLANASAPHLWPISPPNKYVPRTLFFHIERWQREVHHSYPSSAGAEVRNKWSYNSVFQKSSQTWGFINLSTVKTYRSCRSHPFVW